jgi:signal peptidase I
MSSARNEHPVIFLWVLPVCILALLTVIAGGALNVWALRLYTVPTHSMSPTISPGDTIVVEKFTYCFSQPKRGDLVGISVYELHISLDKGEIWCRRIIGVPGDVLEVKFGRIHVNGCPLSECKPPVAPTDRIGPLSPYPSYLAGDEDHFFVQEGTYFVIGDNLADSLDSRYLGPFSRKSIVSKVAFILHSRD